MREDLTCRPLSILQVNTHERWGGAEGIARNLFQEYRRRGLNSYLAVGYNLSGDTEVLEISHEKGRGLWYGFWRSVKRNLFWLEKSGPRGKRLREMVGGLAEPARILDTYRGLECFRFPGTHAILDLPPQPPDIVHAHNLHGWYFDLRLLPWLSCQVPLVLTLHDGWLLSGHCSHSFECDRWKTGCGQCPDLSIYPEVRRDGTAFNWRRKRAIYTQSCLYVATPSAWLMRMVEQSMLAPAIVGARVIPNGVDLSIFKPDSKRKARRKLGLPLETQILLFAASGIRENKFKDYKALRAAVAIVAAQLDRADVLLLALGESAEPERIGKALVQFIPFEPDPSVVAQYYQAADLYLHAARADTFPTTILEALACGTPVVATAVGGIPEQVKSLTLPATTAQFARKGAAEATGVLIAPGDADGMAQSVITLLEQAELYAQVAGNATKDARQRFDLQRQCDAYSEWYYTILEAWQTNKSQLNHPMDGAR